MAAPPFAILEMWAGSSKIEPGITPAHPVTLTWNTFREAANEAGMSRRYGGIHFRAADLTGRLLGRLVAFQAWSKAQTYFSGTVANPADSPRITTAQGWDLVNYVRSLAKKKEAEPKPQ